MSTTTLRLSVPLDMFDSVDRLLELVAYHGTVVTDRSEESIDIMGSGKRVLDVARAVLDLGGQDFSIAPWSHTRLHIGYEGVATLMDYYNVTYVLKRDDGSWTVNQFFDVLAVNEMGARTVADARLTAAKRDNDHRNIPFFTSFKVIEAERAEG